MLVELDDVLKWFRENLYDYQDPSLDYLLGNTEWETLSADLRAYFERMKKNEG
jgi:hypothetical protein